MNILHLLLVITIAYPLALGAQEIQSQAEPEEESTTIGFGDGLHGRIPHSEPAAAGQNEIRMNDAPGSERGEGDPDQPIIIGRVPNSRKPEATHVQQRRGDDGD
jgi:septal ring-binding cell division protein DamX